MIVANFAELKEKLIKGAPSLAATQSRGRIVTVSHCHNPMPDWVDATDNQRDKTTTHGNVMISVL